VTALPTAPPTCERVPGNKPGQPQRKAPKHSKRRAWLLARLAEADGPTYDDLCCAIVERFRIVHDKPNVARFLASARGVRAVRSLLWDELATTESDQSVWLTPARWTAVEQAREGATS
jgi:hypothetical protein